MFSKLRNYSDIYGYHRERSTEFAEHDFRDVYRAARDRLEAALGGPAEGLRMLDVGCGQRYPATMLFTAAGHTVTGIDTQHVERAPGVGAFLRICRADGFERAVKTLSRQMLFDPAYYARLEALIGATVDRRTLDIRTLSVTETLPFPDGTFDAIISNAVFEHIPDVPAAVREVKRVLKPGGVCHIGIHLFPSLSGGHHMRWAFPESDPPTDVPPWDHLRDRRFPSHVYLNELVESDYRAAFASDAELELCDWVTTRTEGETFLSAEIEAELSDRYTRDDLLKREVIVVGRRCGQDRT